MSGLVEAAAALGFKAYGATGEFADLKKVELPCIAHVIIENRLQHFVVVYEITAKGILIGDPARGLHRLSEREFLTIWQQKAVLILTPGGDLFHERPTHWFNWILGYFRKEDSWLYQTIFLGIISTLLGLLVAVFVQWLIDRFIPERDSFKILITAALLFGLLILKAGAGYLRQRFLIELNKRVNMKVNADFLTHIFHLPLRFFNTRKKGDITARINDSIKIQMVLLQFFGSVVIDGLVILGSLSLLFILALPLALLAIATMPFYAIMLFLATRKIKLLNNEAMKSYAQVESFYIDSLDGIEDILGYNSSTTFARNNRVVFKNFQHRVAQLGLTHARIGWLSESAAGILTIGALGFGAILVIQNVLLLGQMMAAYSLLTNLLPAINRLVDANISLQGASIAIQRLFDLLLVEKEKSTGMKPFRMTNGVFIKHANFTWPKGNILFDDLTLTIKKGQITALWGINGAGKSTLARVLQRKYPLTRGQILVDDVSIDSVDLCDLRKNIALMPQKIKIFNGTLLENILIGREVKEPAKIQDCIDEFDLTGFFSRFSHGLLTTVGEEGRQLSAGEMQIIGLLRAILDKPQLLIVDEGINAIDAGTANFIFEALHSYARYRAVLLISHNVRMLARADYLYLLERGTISAEGKPARLLATNNYFQALWKSQQHSFELVDHSG